MKISEVLDFLEHIMVIRSWSKLGEFIEFLSEGLEQEGDESLSEGEDYCECSTEDCSDEENEKKEEEE